MREVSFSFCTSSRNLPYRTGVQDPDRPFDSCSVRAFVLLSFFLYIYIIHFNVCCFLYIISFSFFHLHHCGIMLHCENLSFLNKKILIKIQNAGVVIALLSHSTVEHENY